MSDPAGRVLRRLAVWLVRGPEAPYILGDLEDALEHDVARGLPSWRVRGRYAVNMVASAVSVWRSRLAPSRFGFSWMDVKLGLRMLVKYPALTLVSLFALAIGIPVGVAPMHLVNAIEAPLPVDGGEQIKHLREWNTTTNTAASTFPMEFGRWQSALRSFDRLGAVRSGTFAVDADSARPQVVLGARVTPSVFDILRVSPLLGRTLVAADGSPGAPDVVVLGYDVWQVRFGGDPGIIGRVVSLSAAPYTVVGVMPEPFRFPTSHSLWTPLKLRPVQEPGQGEPLYVFGRLADGETVDSAQAELSAIGGGLALEFPRYYEHLQPEVVRTSSMTFNLPKGGLRALPEFQIIRVVTLLPLVIACVNVGLLIFARSLTRSSEFAVRTALGASRRRILAQVFTESLVLAVLAAAVGLALGRAALGFTMSYLDIRLPYWIDPGIGPSTIAWALSLAAFSAIAAGVLPAIRASGRTVHSNIGRAGGRTGTGGGWLSGTLIVADVALAVVIVALTTALADKARESWTGQEAVGIDATEFLSVQVTVPAVAPSGTEDASAGAAFVARLATTQQLLVQRLEAEPGVHGVAVASVLPRMDHPIRWAEIERDDANPLPEATRRQIRTARVDLGFFRALDQPILAGRAFDSSDLVEGAATVIVNTTFVENVMGGQNPLGRRVRYRAWNEVVPGPWYEIVGVVGQLGMHVLAPEGDAGLYHPATPGTIHPLRLAVHVGPDPEVFTPRLRAILGDVDAAAILAPPVALDKVFEGDWYLMVAMSLGFVLLIGVLLSLAASGLYALMSFAVTSRTREIGIRVALGADRRTIALAIARRSLVQIAVGVLVGLPVAWLVFFELFDDAGASRSLLSSSLVAFGLGVGVMVLVGLAACTVPIRRALRIAPVEALRGD